MEGRDMKQGNKLQSVLVNLGKGLGGQAQVGKVYQIIQYDVAFPTVSHMLANKYFKLRPNLT